MKARWVARASALGASVLLLIIACRDAHAAGCTKDDECKGVRICEKARCVDPPASAAPAKGCQVDSECAGDAVCTASRCVAYAGRPAAPPPPVAPPPPAVPLVPVVFSSKEGAVTVTVSPTLGGQLPPCSAPCTLQIPVGSAYVDARRGDKGYGSNVSIAGPSSVNVELRGRLAPAVALTAVGGLSFFIGFIVFGANGFVTSCPPGSGPNGDDSCASGYIGAGAALMGIGGALAVGGGVGFAFVGKNAIEVVPGGAVALGGRLRFGAAPAPGGVKGGLAWSF